MVHYWNWDRGRQMGMAPPGLLEEWLWGLAVGNGVGGWESEARGGPQRGTAMRGNMVKVAATPHHLEPTAWLWLLLGPQQFLPYKTGLGDHRDPALPPPTLAPSPKDISSRRRLP